MTRVVPEPCWPENVPVVGAPHRLQVQCCPTVRPCPRGRRWGGIRARGRHHLSSRAPMRRAGDLQRATTYNVSYHNMPSVEMAATKYYGEFSAGYCCWHGWARLDGPESAANELAAGEACGASASTSTMTTLASVPIALLKRAKSCSCERGSAPRGAGEADDRGYLSAGCTDSRLNADGHGRAAECPGIILSESWRADRFARPRGNRPALWTHSRQAMRCVIRGAQDTYTRARPTSTWSVWEGFGGHPSGLRQGHPGHLHYEECAPRCGAGRVTCP